MEDLNRYLPDGFMLRNGTYRIERVLGSGGFGNTYLVRHEELDAEMVIKEFFMKGINMRDKGNTVTVSVPDNRATFESQRAKFKKEAQRLWKLKSDHIVGVHDIFEENGTVYYTMDYIDGESLKERLERTGKPMTEAEVLIILPQLLDALSCVHGQKPTLLHLDLKPANILLDKQGKVYLIDFGSSKHFDSSDGEALSTTTGYTYTQGYAPSELIMGVKDKIGPWSDYYSLGATLYNLLTGKSPKEINVHEGEDGFYFPADISPRMRQLIIWLMKPNRKERPQKVSAIEEWLKKGTLAGHKDKMDKEGTEFVDAGGIFQKQNENKKKRFSFKRLRLWIFALLAIFMLAIIVNYIMSLCYDDNTLSPETEQEISEEVPDSVTENPISGEATCSESSNMKIFTVNRVSFNMIRVEGGTFIMGDDNGCDYEKPAHEVTLSTYYIGETEVTQILWEAVMGKDPAYFNGAYRPVECVSWEDCQEFINKLNSITGKHFRLPTEAEWEYAARGGNKSKGYKYSGSNAIDNVAWYYKNAGDGIGKSSLDYGPHNVKTKSSNELGIYNMSGNIREWCQDWFGYYSYSSFPQENPTGPPSGSHHVARGGDWGSSGSCSCLTYRTKNLPTDRYYILGFRLAL